MHACCTIMQQHSTSSITMAYSVQLAMVSVLFFSVVKIQALTLSEGQPARINSVVISGAANCIQRSCPSADILESARSNLSAAVLQSLPTSEPSTAPELPTTPEPLTTPGSPSLSPCGGAGWRRVADLDMADPSQDCPSPWAVSDNPARSCTLSSFLGGCSGVSFTVSGGTYSRVCGRTVGYGRHNPDAFAGSGNDDIDGSYLDGVSVTCGSPRQHVWSFAVGRFSNFYRCPCDNTNRGQAPLPPSFVGDNYFCDGEYNNALWDGEDCTTACCTFNSPPYFTTTLPAPTSDDIEVRICRDQPRTTEEVLVAQLQIYVQ